MKTDRFADSIRRKLESIRPEFTEKDWTRMQSTLGQAGVPQPGPSGTGQPIAGGAWAGRTIFGQPWLAAAAAVSTVVLVGVSLWQRHEINHLRQTVQQLNQQPANRPVPSDVNPVTSARPDVTQADARPNEPAAGLNGTLNQPARTDTVYITRYVGVPERGRLTGEEDVRPSGGSIRSESLPRRGGSVGLDPTKSGVAQRPVIPPERYAATTGTASPELTSLRPKNPTVNPQLKAYDGSSTFHVPNQPTTNPADQPVTTVTAGNSTEGRRNAPSTRTPDNPVAAVGKAPIEAGTLAQPGEQSVAYTFLVSRPLALETMNWNEALARRAKRLRPVRPAPVVESAPVSQPAERLATRFRVGVGTDLNLRLWSVGAFSEVLVGKHWMLGLGVSRATYMGGLFLTDDDFYMRTKRNFRNNYAPGVGPGRDILNIDTRTVRLQVPVTVGYRVPLSQSLTLMPTIGTSLNLSSTENITYYYREPQRGFDKANFTARRPVDPVTNLAFGAGVEWQRGHWVGQAGPVVTVPLGGVPLQPEPTWYSSTAIGGRVRVLYQF